MNIPKNLNDLFSVDREINFQNVLDALGDVSVRHAWVIDISKEIQRVNAEVDTRLLTGKNDFSDLSGRRRGLQYALESALSIHRAFRGRKHQNRGGFDLDSVTVQPSPR